MELIMIKPASIRQRANFVISGKTNTFAYETINTTENVKATSMFTFLTRSNSSINRPGRTIRIL